MKNTTFTTKENTEHKGIELYFTTKPDDDIRTELKKQGFRWHSVKKCWYAKATDKVNTFVANLAADNTTKTTKETKATTNKYSVKVGDVFYCSWGYEQTNIDFYQVIALKGATMATFKKIRCISRPDGYCSNMVKPDIDNFVQNAAEFTRKITDISGEPSCNGEKDYMYMSLTSPFEEHNATSYY